MDGAGRRSRPAPCVFRAWRSAAVGCWAEARGPPGGVGGRRKADRSPGLEADRPARRPFPSPPPKVAPAVYGSQEKWLEFFAVWVRRLAHGGYGKLRGTKRVLQRYGEILAATLACADHAQSSRADRVYLKAVLLGLRFCRAVAAPHPRMAAEMLDLTLRGAFTWFADTSRLFPTLALADAAGDGGGDGGVALLQLLEAEGAALRGGLGGEPWGPGLWEHEAPPQALLGLLRNLLRAEILVSQIWLRPRAHYPQVS